MKLFLFLVSFLVAFENANAGSVSGGGGKSIVCRDAGGSVISAELLDLWEARTLYNQKIIVSDQSLATQVADAIERIKYFDSQLDESTIPKIFKVEAQTFLKPSPYVTRLHGIKLEPTQDSEEIAIPNSCELEQAVNYVDQGPLCLPQIYINQDIVDRLNTTNQAALIIHEILYKYLRSMSQETNSIRT